MARAVKRSNQTLVSIARKEIDSNSIQGFILASTDQLVLLQYVYDFNLDGLMVLSRSEITEICSGATNKFQTGLLKKEGLFGQVPFDTTFDLQDWRSIIRQLSHAYPLIILECERGDGPLFVIGRLAKTTSVAAYVHYFTGTARWLEKLERVEYSAITSCQVGNNYLNIYQRHFEKLKS